VWDASDDFVFSSFLLLLLVFLLSWGNFATRENFWGLRIFFCEGAKTVNTQKKLV